MPASPSLLGAGLPCAALGGPDAHWQQQQRCRLNSAPARLCSQKADSTSEIGYCQGQAARTPSTREVAFTTEELHDCSAIDMAIEEDEGYDLASGVPDAILEAAFDGRPGCWAVHGALPRQRFWSRSGEEAYSIRSWQARPQSLQQRSAHALIRKWGVAAINCKGCKSDKGGGNTYGQDNFCIARLDDGWEVFGVFDGHGRLGHWPSTRAAITLPFFLQGPKCSALLRMGRGEAALHFAMTAVELDIEARAAAQGINIKTSGSTAVVALRDPEGQDLWVATVGDSRAILFSDLDGLVRQTSDHKPNRKDERARVEAQGGEVVGTRYGDGSVDYRICVKGQDYPGIAVSRSLGDLAIKDIGVSAEPEIVKWSLRGLREAYLLVCSDGVWEWQSSEEVASVILDAFDHNSSPQDAVQALLARSQEGWRRHCGLSYCDDITMVLAPITGGQAPRWDKKQAPEKQPRPFWSLPCRQSSVGSDRSPTERSDRRGADSDSSDESDASSVASDGIADFFGLSCHCTTPSRRARREPCADCNQQ